MALLAVFILDTLIAHRIYKSRAGKYGDVLTVFTVLSLGLLRPVFLFAVRNRERRACRPRSVEIE